MENRSLPQISDEEAEFLRNVFNPEVHGEVRLKHDKKANHLIINWFDSCPFSSRIYEIRTHNDSCWAKTVISIHQEYEKKLEENKSLKKLEQENLFLKEQIAALNHKVFGTSSEQLASAEDIQQEPLPPPTPDANVTEIKQARTARGGGRKPLPAHLPRERITYDLPEHDRFCPCCHGIIQVIGEEVTEQLTVIPAQYKVLQHARKKYVCRSCEKFVTAPGPKSLIDKSSYASPEFLAHVACSKYQFGLPFYRQEAIFEQSGFSFNRTTLANLMIGCADKLVAVHAALRQELLKQDVIHADETVMQVLKEPGRDPEKQSWLWLYRSRQDHPQPIVLFDYQQTRQAEHPKHFLGIEEEHAFNGYLQADGYAGYNRLNGVTRVGCMAHVRRKFVAVIKSLPAGVIDSPAHYAEELIGKLYGIERQIKGLPDKIRHWIRQQESVPLLHKFKTWLDVMHPQITPRTGLGLAIRYALDQWSSVSRYVEDGRLAIDNNIAERDIKSVVIGRKNWLFADSVDGAHANAIMYSLVQTAKANNINPYDYLSYVFERMPSLKTSQELQTLLPWNCNMATTKKLQIAAQ